LSRLCCVGARLALREQLLEGLTLPADFSALGDDELRELRSALRELEAAVSFWRRLFQGWLDLVEAGRQVQSEEEPGEPTSHPENDSEEGAEPRAAKGASDLPEFVERIGRYLLGRQDAGALPHPWRYPPYAPPASEELIERVRLTLEKYVDMSRVAAAVSASLLSGEPCDPEETERLRAVESELSQARRELHQAVDRIQQEVIRRIQEGGWKA
jgi:hypothetical protein